MYILYFRHGAKIRCANCFSMRYIHDKPSNCETGSYLLYINDINKDTNTHTHIYQVELVNSIDN